VKKIIFSDIMVEDGEDLADTEGEILVKESGKLRGVYLICWISCPKGNMYPNCKKYCHKSPWTI
jgi:hypothetical protein